MAATVKGAHPAFVAHALALAVALASLAAGCSAGASDNDATAGVGGAGSDASDSAATGDVGSGAAPQPGPVHWVVPSAGLPAEVTLGASNNNLDVARHDGRVFLAFRSSGNHFASPGTVLWVVSSTDETAWRYEGHFAMGTDLREPRFLAWNGRLWLYFAVLGKDPLDFEPKGARAAEYLGVGQWDGPKAVLDFGGGGFIPWRMRVLDDGRPVMIGYDGGENVYDVGGGAIRIHLLTTSDGWHWSALVPGKPVVLEGGGSEADFAVEDDGALVAVVRNEAGEVGDCHGKVGVRCYGAKVCRAEAGDWASWTCSHDAKKYDSPLVFRAAGQTWLIGRRSLKNEGRYDLGDTERAPADASVKYQLAWWSGAKRCALWRVDGQARTVDFVLDLPSAGDTCFASALPVAGAGAGGAEALAVYNYTSPLDDPAKLDINWVTGQLGETRIYRVELAFPGSAR